MVDIVIPIFDKKSHVANSITIDVVVVFVVVALFLFHVERMSGFRRFLLKMFVSRRRRVGCSTNEMLSLKLQQRQLFHFIARMLLLLWLFLWHKRVMTPSKYRRR